MSVNQDQILQSVKDLTIALQQMATAMMETKRDKQIENTEGKEARALKGAYRQVDQFMAKADKESDTDKAVKEAGKKFDQWAKGMYGTASGYANQGMNAMNAGATSMWESRMRQEMGTTAKEGMLADVQPWIQAGVDVPEDVYQSLGNIHRARQKRRGEMERRIQKDFSPEELQGLQGFLGDTAEAPWKYMRDANYREQFNDAAVQQSQGAGVGINVLKDLFGTVMNWGFFK